MTVRLPESLGGNMDTEPVKTTMRGIQAWVLGLEALGFAILLVVNEILKALGAGELPASLISAIMGLLATIVVIYSTQVGGTRLREKVTPWDPETGARTAGPLDYVVDPTDPPRG